VPSRTDTVVDLLVTLSVPLAGASGLVLGHWIRTVRLCCGPERPIAGWEYAASADVELATAGILVLAGGLAVLGLGCRPWLWLPIGLAAAVLVLVAHDHHRRALELGTDGFRSDWFTWIGLPVLCPLIWPLLALAAVGATVLVVRGLSLPTPR